jgi:hypothetical protein
MPIDIDGNILNSTGITSTGIFRRRIIRDGLICYLDGADENSYPGTGTTWTDLSGNGYNGTFVGGVTFNGGVSGGVIVTNGTNGYIDVSTPSLASTGYTVFGGAKYVSTVSGTGRIFSARNNNWLMGWWSGRTENYYAEGWVTNASGTGTLDTNFRIIAVTGDVSRDLYTIYVNGNATTTNNTGGSAGPNQFRLGSYQGASEWANAQISFFLVYNRVLERNEISQNYEALRGRLSL